jgi:hypothetical protein
VSVDRDLRFDFGIVVPHLDHSDHLIFCLNSIINQEGPSSAHIHVQDGGASQEVAQMIKKVVLAMDADRFKITHSQEPDDGAANGINKGMLKVSANMVTWLGADDILMPGCFEMVRTLVLEHPTIEWLTGLSRIILANGIPVATYGPIEFESFPLGFSRLALAIGEHADGPNHGFVQQEGTFLSSSLWKKVGGLDESFRLAFDFDLWCRAAAEAELVQINAPLACFRVRPGQASENRDGYFREVSDVRNQVGTARLPPGPRTRDTVSVTAYFDRDSCTWKVVRRRFKLTVRHQRQIQANRVSANKIGTRISLFLAIMSFSFRPARFLLNLFRQINASRRGSDKFSDVV